MCPLIHNINILRVHPQVVAYFLLPLLLGPSFLIYDFESEKLIKGYTV